MVQHPTAYSPPFEDVVYAKSGKGSKKKQAGDINFANQMAKTLVSKLQLPKNVQHYPSNDPQKPDFIFDGVGFHDPGDTVEWAEHALELKVIK
jgi:hypothetical protein